MVLDFSRNITTQTKKEYMSTSNVSNQYTETFSPSYQIQIESPYAGQSKKDIATQNPNIIPTSTPTLTSNQESKAGGTPAIDFTSIGIVGIILVAGYFLIRK